MFSGDKLKHIGALFGAFILTTAAVTASVEPTRAALSPSPAAQTAADRTVASTGGGERRDILSPLAEKRPDRRATDEVKE